ncbi:hypothetical protein [Streptomyces griseomycini]|uniref:Uncharacterized protein n=1 Tax=Streptomyces griseomycini TaxID=66895 RepID=A0A7W7PWK7_9ACTN|nr:hypothetical protein [Streptomyces griseomycini]MBB4902546.1 hypothetical protein [Streptomyces griseomycini]GGR52321.1 hypothetical protein GCM10015536_67380 [Streptomyces griseomycini]
MSTTSTPPTVSGEPILDLVRGAYARSGTLLDRDVVDLHLLEAADKAACSLLRDQWTDGFPVAAYSELLSTIAALRSILGYSPTPTARDANTWARRVGHASKEAAGDDADFYEVQIIDGPHKGIILPLWGPKMPQTPDALAGPPLTLELPIERGDSTDMEYGSAYYRRCTKPRPTTMQWDYQIDRERPFPAEGSRPSMLPAAGGQEGRA